MCIYLSLLEKAMVRRKNIRYPTSEGCIYFEIIVAVRNMLTPSGLPTLDIKDLFMIEALFDCASRRTQGSSAETVHEAAIAGSFLLWPLFLTRLF